MPSQEEPRADVAPVRRFKDPDYVPQAASLGELRAKIDALDERIVALLAERGRYVRDATRFKRDAFQVSAPQRQEQVFARVRELAARHEQDFPGLSDVVETAYRTLVAAYIAGEGRFFDDTEAIES
ncbi:MAG: chorismate mutase [Burkholderiaceae bacterium]